MKVKLDDKESAPEEHDVYSLRWLTVVRSSGARCECANNISLLTERKSEGTQDL